MPLPPLWALGYNPCRCSYYPESRVPWVADTLRVEKPASCRGVERGPHVQLGIVAVVLDHAAGSGAFGFSLRRVRLFRQPVVQSTHRVPGNPLEVLGAPSRESESRLYEDDGETLACRKGNFMKRQFRQIRDDGKPEIEISTPERTYHPVPCSCRLELWSSNVSKKASLEGGNQPARKETFPGKRSPA